MSLLYKRSNSPYWYVTKTRKSTKTANRKLAEEFARKSLTEYWRETVLRENFHTWDELKTEWLDRKEGLSSFEQDYMVIDRFSKLLRERDMSALRDISAEAIQEYAKSVKEESSASTANRHLNVIRAMLRRAKAKEWIERVPTIENYRVTKVEPNWLTPEQFNSIIAHLPEWVADMAIFAVQTGLRYSNVAGLRWDWIGADGNVVIVPAVHTKTGRTYTVPLSTIAKTILSKLRARHSASVYVFLSKRRSLTGECIDHAPVRTIRYWWDAARDKAGIPNIRWHDLRHTWATWHVQNGTPDRILAQMGGWASTRMLDSYSHLSTDHLIPYADNLNTASTRAIQA